MKKHSKIMCASQCAVSLVVALLLAACGGGFGGTSQQGRQVAAGGVYKIGTPYQIADEWYYPRENSKYDEIGVASWYGEQFHGRRTANGEIFDMNLLTAAHPTLPMPVRARVTNLENRRSVNVRINDRGPFAKDREIDLSRRAAEVLGFKDKGTVRVRVQYLGRAQLYDAKGRLIRVAEPDRFIVAKPSTPPENEKVAAVPVANVEARTLDGEPVTRDKTTYDADKKRYAVQVGVFSKRINAEQLSARLNMFTSVNVSEVNINDNTYYRVKLGATNIRADARVTLENVFAEGHSDAIVIEQ